MAKLLTAKIVNYCKKMLSNNAEHFFLNSAGVIDVTRFHNCITI
jgi:hypothetical protein